MAIVPSATSEAQLETTQGNETEANATEHPMVRSLSRQTLSHSVAGIERSMHATGFAKSNDRNAVQARQRIRPIPDRLARLRVQASCRRGDEQ